MIKELRIAFCGEGTTDSRIIPLLIEKIIGELTPIEPFDLSIAPQRWDTRLPFVDAVVQVVEQAQLSYDLVVAHVDADSRDERQVRMRKVVPAEQAIIAQGFSSPLLIWAIPIQTVEAWLLVSADAFATALGQSQRVRELSFPADPESIYRANAKHLYEESVYQLLAKTRRRRREIKPALHQTSIIERTPMFELRRLSAFHRFEDRLKQVLVTRGYVA